MIDRQRILDAFDVTEDDLAALDPDGSYAAARLGAERQRAEFLAWAETVRREMEVELTDRLRQQVSE